MRARHVPDADDPSLNRTMRRGIGILRAFRPGLSVLTNGDLAELCELPRSTVSRLTGALVDSGLLRQLPGARGYSPTAACISLGFASLQSLAELRQRVLSRMQEAADEHFVSVSLAIPDGNEMIYVDTYRKARREMLLHIEPGARLPMEFTAMGRSALAIMPEAQREARIAQLLAKQKTGMPRLRAELRAGLAHHAEHGWCQASWVTNTVGVARAIALPGWPVLAFNCAGSTAQMSPGKIARKLVPLLFELTGRVAGAGDTPPTAPD
ncbi:MAG: helix-turn-helix domain-containing protein [Chitinophagaceae bacterium]|nr:helix-turn-helix domain-containing protein [Rubrivivax sp.]